MKAFHCPRRQCAQKALKGRDEIASCARAMESRDGTGIITGGLWGMILRDEHKYDDIINLPRHISSRHPQMPLSDRAAQFSPFAALTGYGAAIEEAARVTDDFAELDESRKEQLDEQLQLLRENQSQRPEIEVTYFRPDLKKAGGAYRTFRGRVKKIDEYSRRILFTDGTVLPMEQLFSIEGELFG